MENLPLELRSIIASYLDDKSRRAMRLANKEWFNRIQYSDFKFYFTTEEQLPHILTRLAQYSWPISVDFKKQKFQVTKENCEYFGRLTHLTGLCVDLEKANPHPFTNLTNLEYVECSLPMETMKYFTKLKNMQLESMEDAMKVDLARFTNLETLDWYIDDEETDLFEDNDPLKLLRSPYRLTRLEIDCPPLPLDEKNLSRFTNLKRFSLTMDGKGINMPYLPNLESLKLNMPDVCSLVPLHRTLTDLTVHCYSMDLFSMTTLTNLRKLMLSVQSATEVERATYWTALTNLEKLLLYPCATISDYSQSLQFVTSEKLTSLEYQGDVDMQYIAKLGKKLQSLTVHKISCQNNESLQLFSNLTNLRVIECRKEQFPIIEALTRIEDLYIRIAPDPDLTSADVLHLDKLTNLKSLSVSANMINNRDDISLIHDDSFKHLQLTKLCYERLIDERFLARISAMTSLQYIYFAHSGLLVDSSISLLTSLTNLTSLNMRSVSNKMTGVTLTLLTSLQDLHVHGSFTEFIDSATLQKRLTRLSYVYIS